MKKYIIVTMAAACLLNAYSRPQKSGYWPEVPDFPYALRASQDKDIKTISPELKKSGTTRFCRKKSSLA